MAEPFVVVIPARHASTRLPGKPLRLVAGKPLLQHVHERARASAAEAVIVATDDERIRRVAEGFGAEVCMTDPAHRSGTDRLAEVARRAGWPDERILVNLQGDEPLMPPALLDQVAADLARHPDAGIATLATPIEPATPEALGDPHSVKVVLDQAGYALYFSRAPIPWERDRPAAAGRLGADYPFLRHLGLYAYRAGYLRRHAATPEAPIEACERLEQLRALYQGVRIHVSLAQERPGPGVDTEADLRRVEALLAGGS